MSVDKLCEFHVEFLAPPCRLVPEIIENLCFRLWELMIFQVVKLSVIYLVLSVHKNVLGNLGTWPYFHLERAAGRQSGGESS